MEWRVQRDGIGLVSCPSSDLLAEIFFTAPAEIFLKTKQKYFCLHDLHDLKIALNQQWSI